jgi:hypothetical protein
MTSKVRRLNSASSSLPIGDDDESTRYHHHHNGTLIDRMDTSSGMMRMISNDLLDVVWSFLKASEQLTTITSVCHHWDTLNKNGLGWNGYKWNSHNNGSDSKGMKLTNEQIFDVSKWAHRGLSPSIWYKLLTNRWHHIRSLTIPHTYGVLTYLQPRLLTNLRQLQCSYVRGDKDNEFIDIITKLPKLESLVLTDIYSWSGSSICWPPSLTSLSLSTETSDTTLAIDRKGRWNHILDLTLIGQWQLEINNDGPTTETDGFDHVLSSLTSLFLQMRTKKIVSILSATSLIPSLTSLSLSHVNIIDIPLIVPHLIYIKRLEFNGLGWYGHHELIKRNPHIDDDVHRELEAAEKNRRIVSLLMTLPIASTTTPMNEPKRGLVHLGLPSACTGPLPLDDILPLISSFSSFTIMDGGHALVKWITSNVIKGLLPLLQKCHFRKFAIFGIKSENFPSYNRNQIMKGAMLNLIHDERRRRSEPKKSLQTLVPRGYQQWHSMNRGPAISTPPSSLSAYAIVLLDTIFSYLNTSDKWFIIERACRTWLHASRINGCGWQCVTISKADIIPIDGIGNEWTYLINNNRLSRIRRASFGGYQLDGSVDSEYYRDAFRVLHQWLPRLSAIDIITISRDREMEPNIGVGGVLLSPLHHCSCLRQICITLARVSLRNNNTDGKEWVWHKLPPSLTHLHLCYYTSRQNIKLAIPITWQQQLQSLTLKGRWIPSFHQITQPWLSLTQVCYEYSSGNNNKSKSESMEKKQIIASFIDLFANRGHLVPNLIDLQFPHFDSHQLIEYIANSTYLQKKLKRFDIGQVSPLTLLRLSSLTSFGIWLPISDSEWSELIDDIKIVLKQMPLITSLNIYGSIRPDEISSLASSLAPCSLILLEHRYPKTNIVENKWSPTTS